MVLKPFTVDDWHGLGGAEPFADSSEPLVGTIEVDGYESIAVVDAHGLTILVLCPEGTVLGTEVAYRVLISLPGAKTETKAPAHTSLACSICATGSHVHY